MLLINNCSTDDTIEVARDCWPADAPAPLRIVEETRCGQAFARLRAFQEARYEIVSFIDDDNWVEPDWLEKVHAMMSANPSIGALGGLNFPAADQPLPAWFLEQQHSYAVGPQSSSVGDITECKAKLCGAGLNVRKIAFEDLCRNGFRFLLSGRNGEALDASEDYELCYALALAGWRIWYEPSLRMKHYLGEERLTWSYLRRLSRSNSRSGVLLDPYLFALGRRDGAVIPRWSRRWISKVLVSSARLFIYSLLALFSLRRFEGNRYVLTLDCLIGRLRGLFAMRSLYLLQIKAIQNAPWRKKSPSLDPSEPEAWQTAPQRAAHS